MCDDHYHLSCGCEISNNLVINYCFYHADNQPQINDPLDLFYKLRAVENINDIEEDYDLE
jgi:hypothetical protein